MEVQTDITMQDLIDFNLYHFSRSPIVKRQRSVALLFGVAWSGLCLAICALNPQPLKTAEALLPLVLFGPLYIGCLLVAWRWSVPRQVKKHLSGGVNKGIFGPQKIILSAEGVADIGELSQSTTRWEAVEKVVVTLDCLYIYVNTVAAVIVPRRSFSQQSAFEEFVQKAQEYHAQATIS